MTSHSRSRLVVWVLGFVLLTGLLSACRAEVEPTKVAMAATATAPAALTSTPTPAPTSTPTASPTPTVSPTATATPTATPTPRAIQLTSGGCCTQPFWSADSGQVRYIDKPGPQSPVGIWGVNIAEPLAQPMLVSERIEESLARDGFLVETNGNTTVIEDVAAGTRWPVPANGRTVIISPDRTRIAWSISNDDLPVENQVTSIWAANLDGSDARKVATYPRGSLSGWISEDALLVSGRDSLQAREQWLAALSLVDGSTVELARAERLRGAVMSHTGSWVVYYITFGDDVTQNGLWLARTDGSERRPLDRELFGAYQWRGCADGCSPEQERLVLIPFRPDAEFHQLWELNPSTGDLRQLTDPAVTPFKIANGDWRLSPDGNFMAFVESSDKNIWVIGLPR